MHSVVCVAVNHGAASLGQWERAVKDQIVLVVAVCDPFVNEVGRSLEEWDASQLLAVYVPPVAPAVLYVPPS